MGNLEWYALMAVFFVGALTLNYILVKRKQQKFNIESHQIVRNTESKTKVPQRKLPPVTAPGSGLAVDKREPYRQVISIRIPPMDWNPKQAIRLIDLLLAPRHPLIFAIRAKHGEIVWSIEAGKDQLESIRGSLYSVFPQADIDIKFKSSIDRGFVISQFAGGANFMFESKRAFDFSKGISPINAVISSLSGITGSDEIVYEVAIRPPSLNYTEIANQLLYFQNGGEIYVPEQQTRLEKKAFSSLFDVQITWKFRISRDTRENMIGIGNSLLPALANNMATDKWFFLARSGSNSYNMAMCVEEIATLWHLPTSDCKTAGISWARTTSAPLPSALIRSNVAESRIQLGEHSYHGQKNTVWLSESDRITHMNIVGKTRVGKTTFMHNLIHQDIKAGKGVGVIDPHGDLVQAILERSIPPGREKDVVLFDLSDLHYIIPLNLLYVPPGVAPHAGVSLTMGVLKKLFAEQWSATRMEDALYSALTVLSSQQSATIRDIPRIFLNADYRRDVLKQSGDEVALEYFHDDYEQMSERYQLEVARPIMNRIRAFYRNPVIREIVTQPDSIDFREIMDEGKIFLASLAGEATQGESATIGALLISKMQMAAMSRFHVSAEERQLFYLYIDEVQNFVTTSLSVMFSEAAKYALSLTVANQFLKQLEGGTLDAVMGNTGTNIIFASGNQDASDLGAYVKPEFDSQTLLNLDRFESIIKMQKNGKTLPAFLIKTPPPIVVPDDADERKARIRSANYREKEAVVDNDEKLKRVVEDMEEVEEAFDGAKDTDIPTLDL